MYNFNKLLPTSIRRFSKPSYVFYLLKVEDENEENYFEIVYLNDNEAVVLRKDVIKEKDFKQNVLDEIRSYLLSDFGSDNADYIINILNNYDNFNKFIFGDVVSVDNIIIEDNIERQYVNVNLEISLTDFFELYIDIYKVNGEVYNSVKAQL